MSILAQLQQREVTLPVDVDGIRIEVTYRRGRLTRGFLDTLGELTVDQALQALLVSWDLEGEDGAPAPLTAEVLESIDLAAKSVILRAILEHLRPNPTASAN